MQPQYSCIPANMRVGLTFWKTFVSCSLLTTWIRKCALIGRERLRPQSVEACGVVVRPRAIRGSKHQLLSYELTSVARVRPDNPVPPVHAQLHTFTCLDEEEEERYSQREAAKRHRNILRDNIQGIRPSQPCVVWLAEVVSNVSLDSSWFYH